MHIWDVKLREIVLKEVEPIHKKTLERIDNRLEELHKSMVNDTYFTMGIDTSEELTRMHADLSDLRRSVQHCDDFAFRDKNDISKILATLGVDISDLI